MLCYSPVPSTIPKYISGQRELEGFRISYSAGRSGNQKWKRNYWRKYEKVRKRPGPSNLWRNWDPEAHLFVKCKLLKCCFFQSCLCGPCVHPKAPPHTLWWVSCVNILAGITKGMPISDSASSYVNSINETLSSWNQVYVAPYEVESA